MQFSTKLPFETSERMKTTTEQINSHGSFGQGKAERWREDANNSGWMRFLAQEENIKISFAPSEANKNFKLFRMLSNVELGPNSRNIACGGY